MKKQKIKGGARKLGRNKRPVDLPTSKFVRGKISFEQYASEKGINFKPQK
ncbi:MAG: hypothetical protein WC554_01940 [Clostridia bacterium]